MLRRFRPELVRLAPYAALLVLAAVLVSFRVVYTGTVVYVFLLWNLFLAALPLGASTVLRLGNGAGVRRGWLWAVVAFWLLFLPNAPYVLTDLIHLRERAPVPLWYDLAVLLTAAGTGLALAYRSLLDVEAVVSRWLGRRVAVGLSVVVLFLSGFGIYLGRFLRLNSWDVATDPLGVLVTVADRFIDPMAHPRTWGVTVLFGLLLSLGYAAVRPRREAPQSETVRAA